MLNSEAKRLITRHSFVHPIWLRASRAKSFYCDFISQFLAFAGRMTSIHKYPPYPLDLKPASDASVRGSSIIQQDVKNSRVAIKTFKGVYTDVYSSHIHRCSVRSILCHSAPNASSYNIHTRDHSRLHHLYTGELSVYTPYGEALHRAGPQGLAPFPLSESS